jgi:hypothetical protein
MLKRENEKKMTAKEIMGPEDFKFYYPALLVRPHSATALSGNFLLR